MHLAIREELEHISTAELDAALSQLPEWRRTCAQKFKFVRGQAECAFSYLMLCQLLHTYYNIIEQPSFIIGEHGKPSLAEYPNIHFNISHCKEAIAVAVSDAPIGIDVECIGRGSDSLARHVLNDEEYQQMKSSADPAVAFARFWTQKEALYKLIGTGITDDIRGLLTAHPDARIDTRVHEKYVLSIAEAPQTE